MNPWATAAATLLLWTAATGVGLLGAASIFAGTLPRTLALRTLLGLCTLAATLPIAFLLGLPRSLVLAGAYAVALAGWLRHGADAARSIDRHGLLAMAVTLAMLSGVAAVAINTPTTAYDAQMTWWPKVVEVGHGEPTYLGAATPTHSVPTYPRGLAWLASVAHPFGSPTQQVMHMTSWLWVWMTALLLVAAARPALRDLGALTLATLLLLLPDVAFQASAGLADVAIGAATLLVALGLGARAQAHGYAVAAIGSIGAASMKTEGFVVLLVFACHCLADLRQPRLRRRALCALTAGLLTLPTLLQRSSQPETRMDILPSLVQQPDVVVARGVAAIEANLRLLVSPTALADTGVRFGPGAAWPGWLVLGCLVLLLLARRPGRTIAVSPALALLPAAVAVQVTTGVDVNWHVATTLHRLMVEVCPTVLLAAALAACGSAAPPVPRVGVAG
jgi:hypothetical protein